MKKYLLKKYLPKLIVIGIIVFFSLMEGAAGADAILQPRELQQYIRHNDVPFFREITKLNDREKALANAPETPQQLLGLRKYLLNISLIGEREIKELPLWKEYLVYATLFGIADKVCDNFATVYPDFFQTNTIAGTRQHRRQQCPRLLRQRIIRGNEVIEVSERMKRPQF